VKTLVLVGMNDLIGEDPSVFNYFPQANCFASSKYPTRNPSSHIEKLKLIKEELKSKTQNIHMFEYFRMLPSCHPERAKAMICLPHVQHHVTVGIHVCRGVECKKNGLYALVSIIVRGTCTTHEVINLQLSAGESLL